MKKTQLFLLGACLSLGMAMGANAETFSTKDYSLEVPDEAVAIADIEINEDNTISFFEKLAHESQMGYLGTVCLFDKADDYLTIPHYEWVGAIVKSDGTEKQVVLDLPSDVQVDFEKPDSLDNYHTLSAMLRDTIVPSLTPADGVYLAPAQVDHTGVYEDTLAKLREMIEAKASVDELGAAGFTNLYHEIYEDKDALNALKVAYVDLANTGFPAMAIMAEDGTVIYNLFTQKDGEVISRISGTEGDHYSFCGYEETPDKVMEEIPGSGDYTETEYLYYDALAQEFQPTITLIYDPEAKDGPYFMDYHIEGTEAEAVSEEDWDSYKENQGAAIVMNGLPLFEGNEEVAVG